MAKTGTPAGLRMRIVPAMGLLVLGLGLVLVGCKQPINDPPELSEQKQEEPVFVSLALKAKPIAASSTGTPNVIASYPNVEGTSNFYLIDAGYIQDMYISTVAEIDYTGVPTDFTHTKTTTTENSIIQSLTRAVTDSVMVSQTSGIKTSISAGVGYGPFSVKGKFELSYGATGSILFG